MNSTVDVDSERFILYPVSFNAIVNQVTEFQCQHSTANQIRWKINGTILMNIPEGIAIKNRSNVFTLSIAVVSEYNRTVISCVALFNNSPSKETKPAILMVQGT